MASTSGRPPRRSTVYGQRIIDHFQLASYFTQILGSKFDLTRTEKAHIIAEILSAYPNVVRQSVVMVGDCEHDIIGARAQHIDAIGVTHGYGSLDELDTAGATAIADTVDELAGLLM